MGSFRWFLFVYILGGLTFLPLVLLFLLAFAYYTFPDARNRSKTIRTNDPADLVRNGDLADQKLAFRTGTDDLAEKFHRRHDSDVATGYFAVCREYVPGGVNGKPPEKLSPAGEIIAQESPSVYQSMYRSIFDRSHKPTIEPYKDGAGRNSKRTNNVFFVVLRHGHLMLYDDIQQVEVRYVISLEHHHVDIYGGENEMIPESELWIKRNAIRLQRRAVQIGDKATSLPFFFFSENLSEKEDFYHAILANQEKNLDNPPIPQDFDTRHIIGLVQKLHSSEEQLQTRWLNALLGRLFLALYKTPFVESMIRQKLTKKISRVKKPNFITKLALQKIDTGTAAPLITNPRLKDLTVNGDCVVELDLEYTGQCRLEIAATARIDLGSRFKAREVDMVLAATCKKLSGHMLLKLKPPPSNRLWFTFETMPKIDMTLEPIVSSRQITYNVILKALESRIIEVFAEALVLPYWDDMPFLDTSQEQFRGGVWKHAPVPTDTVEIKDESPEHEAETNIETLKREDRNLSMPVLSDTDSSVAVKAAKKSAASLRDVSATSADKTPERQTRAGPPRALRSSSFATVVDPTLSPTHVGSDMLAWDAKAAQKRDSMLKDLSQRPLGTSPEGSASGSLPKDSVLVAAMRERGDSVRSSKSSIGEEARAGILRRRSSESHSTPESPQQSSIFSVPTRIDTLNSETSRSSSQSHALTHDGSAQRQHVKHLADTVKSITSANQKQALTASAISAAQAAQKWGWGVLARNRQREAEANASTSVVPPSPTNLPMGRGRPLPPPGQPLPPPEKPSLFSMAKRRQAPPSISSQLPKSTPSGEASAADVEHSKPSPKTAPAITDRPDRRRRQVSLASAAGNGGDEEVLVIEAPSESNSATPSDEHHDDFFGHGEEDVSEHEHKVVSQADSGMEISHTQPQTEGMLQRHPAKEASIEEHVPINKTKKE